MSPIGVAATWTVLAPPGLSSTGRIRRFQDRTVARLQATARGLADETLTDLKAQVEAAYTEGVNPPHVRDTLQYKVNASRDGVEVQFMAGTNHLVFLTALAGEGSFSPEGHIIEAHNVGFRGGQPMLRFFWKNPPNGSPGVYRMHAVRWRTRVGRDVIGEVLSAHAGLFEREMIRAHDEALVQFVQENAQPATRSPRVSAFPENQIDPYYRPGR